MNLITKRYTSAISASMESVLATQLASLKFNATSLTLVNNQEVLNEIEKCIGLLNSKSDMVSKLLTNKNNYLLKDYNINSLNLIQVVNKENSDMGIFTSDKKQKKINLLLRLESIQISYLYLSVNTLYQQVYQEIWNSLDSDSRFTVSQKAINIEKRGIYESF